MSSEAPSHPILAWWRRVWRWLVLTFILAGGIVSYIFVQVCEEQLADTGQVVTVCRKLAATDVPVIIGALVVVLLVLPLFSELSFFGVTLKRSVENTAKKAKELESRVDRLATIAIGASNVKVDIDIGEAEARGIGEEEMVSKKRMQEAVLKEMLLSIWNRLEPYLTYLPPESRVWIGSVELPVRSWPEPTAFAREHAAEINKVREVRNAIAHGLPVAEDAIREAIESGYKLLGIIEKQGG